MASPLSARGAAVGIDLGRRRIGVAVSDSKRVLAHPERVITRSGDDERDRREIARVIDELGGTVVVVGLPVALSGALELAARQVLEEVEALRSVLPVPVETMDERLTTAEALRRVREVHEPARGRRRSVDRSRVVVDDKAAAILLQAWIDAGTRDR